MTTVRKSGYHCLDDNQLQSTYGERRLLRGSMVVGKVKAIALLLVLLACLSAGAPTPAVKMTLEDYNSTAVPMAIALTDAAKKLEMKANQTSVENLKCLPDGTLIDRSVWDPNDCSARSGSNKCCITAGATVCCTKSASIWAYLGDDKCRCCTPGKDLNCPTPAVKKMTPDVITPEDYNSTAVPMAIALTDAAKKLEMKANQTSVENLKCSKGTLDRDDWWKGDQCNLDPDSCCKATGATKCCTKHAALYPVDNCLCCDPKHDHGCTDGRLSV